MILLVLANILFKSFLLSGSDVADKTDAYLNQKLKQYDSYEYSFVKTPDVPFEYEQSADFKINTGVTYLPVKIKSASGEFISSFVIIKLKVFKSVLVALSDIQNKSSLQIDLFDTRVMDVTYLRGETALLKDITNSASSCYIKSGTVLLNSMIKKNSLINEGDKIKAVLNTGNVSVSFEAFAKEGGYEGELIKVMNAEKKTFTGRILTKELINILY